MTYGSRPPRRPRAAARLPGPRQVVGVAWYSPAAWARLKSAVPDPDRLEDSHPEWLEVATASCAKLTDIGVEFVRVDFDAEEFLAWCGEQGRAADSAARAHFTAEMLRRRSLGRKP